MKAPDKLYLSWIIWGSFINTIRDPDNDTQVEYICKDALLEWAEEEMMKAARSSEAYGRRNAFMDVIDKIESL